MIVPKAQSNPFNVTRFFFTFWSFSDNLGAIFSTVSCSTRWNTAWRNDMGLFGLFKKKESDPMDKKLAAMNCKHVNYVAVDFAELCGGMEASPEYLLKLTHRFSLSCLLLSET